MFKITIDNEEVITDKDFTIEEEMLNTPSVILNNVYPKEWEQDKDYLNFYHPNEYSKCKIYDEEIIPASEGDYIEGTDFSITYDDTKEFNLLSLKGETSQGTTTGRNLFDKSKISSVNNGTNNNGVITSTTNSSAGTKNVVIAFSSGAISVSTNTTIYFSADIKLNSNSTGTFSNINDNVNGGTTKILRPTLSTTYQRYQTSFKYNSSSSITAMLIQITNLVGSVEISNIMISTSSDAIYEIFTNGASPNPSYPQAVDTVTGRQDIYVVGKNLFDYTTTVFTNPSYVNIETQNETITITTLSTQTSNNLFLRTKIPDNLLQHGATYTISSENVSGMVQSLKLQLRNKNGNNAGQPTGYSITYDDTYSLYIVCNPFATTGSTSIPAGTTAIVKNVQVEKSSSSSTYESFKEHTYELNLGKNYFDINGTIQVGTLDRYNYGFTLIRGTNRVLNIKLPQMLDAGTYTLSFDMVNSNLSAVNKFGVQAILNGTGVSNNSDNNNHILTFTTTSQFNALYFYILSDQSNDATITIDNIQLEKGSTKTSFSPYKTPIELCKIGNYQDYIFKNTTDSDYYDSSLEQGAWYLLKRTGKVVLNGSESWTKLGSSTNPYKYYTSAYSSMIQGLPTGTISTAYSSHFRFAGIISNTDNVNMFFFNMSGGTTVANGNLTCTLTGVTSAADFKTWLSSNNVSIYFPLLTPTTELIEDTELLGQLEEINLLNGLNNISVSSPYLTTPIKIHYNFNEEIINQDLYFCGVVKNSGNISLNPREPHFQSLQVLSYKTFLSEGETLDFVIYQKTIREAIEQVVSAIQDYGFIVGDINILNPDEIIGAYSTKDKSAYDVFQYIADITQSRWTTRMIDEDTIAIDFYDPSLMQLGTTLDYTQEFFEDNLIDDMSYSYGTNDYRNKQVMTSQEVYSNINQIQNIVANGYQTQFNTEQQIGKINSIKIGGVDYTFATNTEKDMGVIADFYYSAGNNYFESASTISIGTVIVIDYLPIVEGRQIITNSNEIDRVANSTGVKGVVARYENRNDATTSTELQLIGQSYIKYKGVPEIVLTVITRKNIWDVGQRVQFNAPINELAVMYMVRKKAIHRITTIDTIFYTFELVSSFNSETAVNYFDNQRAKANGNIGEGEYISRNIDIQSTANIIFYDTQANEITVVGDNILNCTLESPFVS